MDGTLLGRICAKQQQSEGIKNMPGFFGTPEQKESISASFVDVRGLVAGVSLDDLPTTTTETEAVAAIDSIAALTNTGMFNRSYSSTSFQPKRATRALDEAESSATTKAVLVFQNARGDTRIIAVPAPDASILSTDGQTVDLTNDSVEAANAAISLALNGGAAAGTPDTFGLVSGTISTRTRKGPRAIVRPTIDEPNLIELPDEGPGV
jgi:hypothetical protein